MNENIEELKKRLEVINNDYHDALMKFREVENERNKLQNLIVLPEFKKNIGKCYRKANACIDCEDELAKYQFIKITDAVYDPEGWFNPEPRYVGMVFGMGISGAIHFYPKDYVTINKECEEITSEKFDKEYTRLVNKLVKNKSYNGKI